MDDDVLAGRHDSHRTADAELTRRAAVVRDMREALQRLRSVDTLAELIRRVPAETGRIGYRRALYSRLDGGDWTAQAAFAADDPWLGDELVRIGTASPGRLGRELPETELVRHRAPVIVRDAQHNPRVHRQLVPLAGTKSYVAAPLIARGTVVALIHADEHRDSGTVGSFDRELLGLFAEGLGFAFERVYCQERLRALRAQARAVGEGLDDVLEGGGGELGLGGVGPGGVAPGGVGFGGVGLGPGGAGRAEETFPAPPPSPAHPFHRPPWPLSELTRRELEVLERLCAGESNAQLAASLYVSIETVRTHVKSVLRKLGAANRAEAVALVRDLGAHPLAPSR